MEVIFHFVVRAISLYYFRSMKSLLALLFIIALNPTFSQDALDSLLNEKKNSKGVEEAIVNIKISKLLRNNDLSLAGKHNTEAINILENLEDQDSLLAVALIEMAITYSYKADYDKAFEVNHRGLELATQSKDTLSIIDAYNNMGIDYYYLEDYDKSLVYFERVAELTAQFDNPKRLANAYNNLGLVFSELGDTEKETDYYLRARKIFEETNDLEGIALTDLNLGSVYLIEGDLEQARKSLLSSYTSYEDINNYAGMLDALSSLISLAQTQNQTDRAISMANEGLDLAREKNLRSSIIHYLALLEDLYADIGSFEKAYEMLSIRKTQEDSILNENTNKVIAELETKYETAKKEKEISDLALENDRVSYQLKAQTNQRRFFLAATIALLILALFIAWRYRYKQKLNRVLKEKNQVISDSLEQRETLLKEIHHRVKNNLQIISSLLNLQSRFIKDASAIDAVKEGRNRVKSMAMIHQRLYQGENLTGVSIDEYINNLVDSLEKSYGIRDEKVTSHLDIEPIVLDIDTMIPMGLILNELISNTYKYAFPENRSGNLEISLKKINEHLELSVSDNGVGYDVRETNNSQSFGLTLIQSLVEKLRAEMKILNDQGTSYQFIIKNFKTA